MEITLPNRDRPEGDIFEKICELGIKGIVSK